MLVCTGTTSPLAVAVACAVVSILCMNGCHFYRHLHVAASLPCFRLFTAEQERSMLLGVKSLCTEAAQNCCCLLHNCLARCVSAPPLKLLTVEAYSVCVASGTSSTA